MDLSNVDMKALAEQLRKPEDDPGREVGKVMVQYNAEPYAFIFKCINVQPNDHVLEIGFGPGEGIAEAVRLTPDGYVAGIDHSQTMLTVAEERNHRAIMQEHVELTLGNAAQLPYQDESFDKVFAVNVFHFWPEPLRELTECKRVLKPNGLVAFFLTNPSSWPPGIADTGVFIAREPEEIATILKNAGFQNTETRPITSSEWKGFVVMGTK